MLGSKRKARGREGEPCEEALGKREERVEETGKHGKDESARRADGDIKGVALE